MLIYEALKKDHEKVNKLLTELISLSSDSDLDRGHELIEEIRDELIPHARAEESVFYNSLRVLDADRGLIMHGYKEHVEAEALLRLLQAKDKLDVDWNKTAQKLKAALDHHIAEEEGKIFTAAQSVLTDEEAEMMGEAFERLKPEIREEGFMKTTLDMIANLMPPRFTRSFRANPVDVDLKKPH